MASFVAKDGTGGLAMIDGIHVYGNQLDVWGECVKHRHYFLFIGDDTTVRLREFGEYRTATVHHNIIRTILFHGSKSTFFPFAIAHDINSRKPFGHQHIARNRSHHLAYLTETVMANSTVDGQMT